jgi:hypothetical protein
MNIASPILTGAANAAELPGDTVTSFSGHSGPAARIADLA